MAGFALNRIGQIALGVADVDRAEAFYRGVLGLRHLYRYGDLTFFDCAGVRLLLEKAHDLATAHHGSPIYFNCHDIALAVRELEQRGIVFDGPPHLIAPMDDHDLWMAFFTDPDGHILALMHEAPKGYAPSTAETK
jgi:catechol 2,3-dioxygenase-like lactoylglutathione lyase family enzyme